MTNEIFLMVASRAQWCWLSTITESGYPNVSPKDCFIVLSDKQMIIANVASDYARSNIENNNKVCVSFVDIFSQLGYKLVGTGQVLHGSDANYAKYKEDLEHLMIARNIGPNGINPILPLKNIFLINIDSIYVLKAPKRWP